MIKNLLNPNLLLIITTKLKELFSEAVFSLFFIYYKTMLIQKSSRNSARKTRHKRVRGKVQGTAEMPRLNVFFSLKYVYAQLIDDTDNKILAAVNSLKLGKTLKESKSKVDWAKEVGKKIAEESVKNGVSKVVFDRGGYKYHGKVKALADAARENGLVF